MLCKMNSVHPFWMDMRKNLKPTFLFCIFGTLSKTQNHVCLCLTSIFSGRGSYHIPICTADSENSHQRGIFWREGNIQVTFPFGSWSISLIPATSTHLTTNLVRNIPSN